MKKYIKPKRHFAFVGQANYNDTFTVRYYHISDDEELCMENGDNNWLPVNTWEEADIAEILIHPSTKDLEKFAILLLEIGGFIATLSPVSDFPFIDFDDKEWGCNSIYVYKASAKKYHFPPGTVKRDKKEDTVWDKKNKKWV